MDFQLDDLIDHDRIVAIDAAPIPAPPASSHPGEHLFVNCHYDVSQATRPPHELLETVRADALQIAGRLAGDHSIARYVSAIITVYGHFPCAGAVRPARQRIYRVEVFGKNFPTNGSPITSDFFAQVQAAESSELDDVAELLHAAAT